MNIHFKIYQNRLCHSSICINHLEWPYVVIFMYIISIEPILWLLPFASEAFGSNAFHVNFFVCMSMLGFRTLSNLFNRLVLAIHNFHHAGIAWYQPMYISLLSLTPEWLCLNCSNKKACPSSSNKSSITPFFSPKDHNQSRAFCPHGLPVFFS